MKKTLLIFGTLLLLINLLPNLAQASTLSCSQVDGMAIFGYDGSEWIHIGAIGSEFNSLSIANEFGAGSEFKSTSIMNEFGKYGSEFSSQSAFNSFANKPPIIVNNDYKFLGYITINDYKTPSINTYEAVACAKNSFKSPSRDMEDITFKDISLIGAEGNQIQSQLKTTTDAITSAYSDELDYHKTLNNFYESKAEDLNEKITALTKEEQTLQNAKLAELENNIKNIQNKMANFCTDTYGINSTTLSPGKCSCSVGYVFGKDNKCISLSSWCSEMPNTYMKNGTCSCLEGYFYEDSLKTCKILEVKKEITQPVIIQQESIKISPQKTTPTIKSPDNLKKPTEKGYFEKTVSPKEEVVSLVNSEPVKKLKWYQKIFNWFK
ncbi:MAG: Glycyl-tRNA synthetase subunit alpha [Candidatus Nomurabacteria bacterium GW2011_GWB1_37_5]|uniref:Glycyl-tRNA synthetase subunit alpha n=1 Tax=Candidatus Nomurabacteria bacterium GW2011_GWB1_37_5 TaxID=1618742 RepID=A0A0G0H9Y4_9BACT|nr:MAG: Glycyl-tRNA synthetase subunit alpha [Candidatus Nomurabacteria bacterium GW2011_GWB1_37_5]